MDEDEDIVTPYWKCTLKLWRTVSLRCRNGHYYFEIDNLGRHRCTQHAAEYDHVHNVWPCCKKGSIRNGGCVPADHTIHPFNFTDAHDIHLPNRIILKQLVDGPGVDDTTATVVRFNKEIDEKMNPFLSDGYTLKHVG